MDRWHYQFKSPELIWEVEVAPVLQKEIRGESDLLLFTLGNSQTIKTLEC